MKNKIETKTIIITVSLIIITLLRIVVPAYLPIFPRPFNTDDRLVFRIAKSLSEGNWLGTYNYLTLSKLSGASFIIALFHVLHIPYLVGQSALYVIGCAYLCFYISLLLSKKEIFVISYIILIFNPVSFATDTFQIIYRSGIAATLSLYVIAGYIAIYICLRNRKSYIMHLLGLSVSLPLMLYTREDSVWIFVFVILANISVVWLIATKRISKVNLLLICLPVLCIFGFSETISFLNYSYYGFKGVIDSDNTSYDRVLAEIYAIDDGTDIQRVSVSQKKLQMLYNNSKSLKSIEEYLTTRVNNRAAYSRDKESGEIEGSHFMFALREAVNDAGYYSNFEQSEQFYKSVYEELKQAIDQGELSQEQKMPSVYLSQVKSMYFPLLIAQIPVTNWYVFTFKDVLSGGDSLFSEYSNKTFVDEFVEYAYQPALYVNETNSTSMINRFSFSSQIMNSIGKLYKIINPCIYFFAFVSYITLLIKIMRFKNKINQLENLEVIVFTTILAANYLGLVIAVSYVDVSDYIAVKYKYLAPAYNLLLVNEIVLSYSLLKRLCIYVKNKRGY